MDGRRLGTHPRMTGHVATADVDISASPKQVWNALTDPGLIRKYLFGADVETTWEPGAPIRWRGEYDGRKYEDKGEVVEVVPEEKLIVTHFSPLSGQDDKPENYHTVTYQLEDKGDRTAVHLEQDNNTDPQAAAESQENWGVVLESLKVVVEEGRDAPTGTPLGQE
jgi:uncharacterized protein YndB with AHSA1/START domain